jgi:hypothetical protein
MQLSPEQKELVLKRDEVILQRFGLSKATQYPSKLPSMKKLNDELYFINKQLGI